ncbi:MAG: DUF1998 domain-containing protein [Thaumarchaeota archaeon]|nr:DUF1998 domain-containing protein [Nitrososphaerota archaeon]
MGDLRELKNLKDKPIGMILRNYYPKAFVLHQDVLFRVDGPGQALPGITKDERESNKLMKKLQQPGLMEKIWEKILYELEVHGFNRKEIENVSQFEDDEEEDKINVIVPSKVDLRLDKGLNVGRCQNCGHLHYLNYMLRNSQGLPIHSNCRKGKNSRYKQAPVFVPYPNDPNEATRPLSSDQLKVQTVLPTDVNCLYLKPGGKCAHPNTQDGLCSSKMDEQHSYMMLGPNYPLSGIKVTNPYCPKGLTDIRPRPMITHRAGTGYRYYKKFPDSGITQRLYTTVAWEDKKKTEKIESINNQIREVKKTWFNKDLINFEETNFSIIVVIDLVYGLRIGGYYDHWLRGIGNNNVLGRMLQTQGFVITIKDSIWEVASSLDKFASDEEDPVEDRVRNIVHTLKHAILNQIPTFTGIEETKFGGSYEILGKDKGAKIYLFDNEVGGHGGFETLMNDVSRFSKMIETVYNQTKCPIRKCRVACKHCLFLRNCGLGNHKLNRKMLLESGILQEQV